MKKLLLAILFAVFFIPLFAQNIYNGTLRSTDPFFNRPDEGMPPTVISSIGTDVHYNLITVNVPIAGLVTISCFSIWDNFSILYNGNGFIESSPLTNALQANDDFGGPNSGFTYNFPTPGIYYLVICSFKNNVTGPYVITTSAAIVLPLRLLSFSAAKSANSNTVKWLSANERNLSSYQVQRSLDANNFNDLKDGIINAKNNTASTAYSFQDNNPAQGYNYYRLKITESTGKISYSHVALVKNNRPGITDLKVFPNPVSDYLKIEGKSLLNKKAFLSIISPAGAVVLSGQYIFNNQGVLSVDIKKFPVGKYFLKTSLDNEETTIVFIKN